MADSRKAPMSIGSHSKGFGLFHQSRAKGTQEVIFKIFFSQNMVGTIVQAQQKEAKESSQVW